MYRYNYDWLNDNELDKIIKQYKNEDIPKPTSTSFTYGWVCPKCGMVNAPWVSCCPCSIKHEITTKQEITC